MIVCIILYNTEINKPSIKNAYSKIIAEQPSEKKQKANRLVLSKFGPNKNDECVIGNDPQFQKRRNDIYELVKSMSKSCPGRWEMAGHGFIQFVKSERDSYQKIKRKFFSSSNAIFQIPDTVQSWHGPWIYRVLYVLSKPR